MTKRPFGKTGFDTTPIAFGAMRIQGDDRGISRALLYALEKGVNFIDTARAYGESEAIVGRTLKDWKGARPFIATKVCPIDLTNWRRHVPMHEQFTPASIRSSVEASLASLGVDCIDLVQLHQWYYLWGQCDEWLETLHALRAEGKLRFIGVSAQDHEHDGVLKLLDDQVVDSVQLFMNIFESRPFVSAIPLAKQRAVGVIGRCIFDHSGALAGAATREILQSQDQQLSKGSPEIVTEYMTRVSKLKDFAQQRGMELPELSIRFALSRPGVSNLAISLSSPEHVDTAVAASEKGALPEEDFQELIARHTWVKNFYYFR